MTVNRSAIAILGVLAVPLWAANVIANMTEMLAVCVLGWGLFTLAWIDWNSLRLPDIITLPLIGLGLLYAWWAPPRTLWASVLGAIVGYLIFRIIGILYHMCRGVDGLGEGDAKLLAVGGAWAGWNALPHIVLIAALLGLAAGLIRQRRDGDLHPMSHIPFGPALGLAIWVVRLHGPNIEYLWAIS